MQRDVGMQTLFNILYRYVDHGVSHGSRSRPIEEHPIRCHRADAGLSEAVPCGSLRPSPSTSRPTPSAPAPSASASVALGRHALSCRQQRRCQQSCALTRRRQHRCPIHYDHPRSPTPSILVTPSIMSIMSVMVAVAEGGSTACAWHLACHTPPDLRSDSFS